MASRRCGGRRASGFSATPRRRAARASRPRTRATIRWRRCCCGRCAARARAGWPALRRRVRSLRPFLDVDRATLERYAAARGITWVEDPSNARLDFLRNRVRHELLPALRRADPTIDEAILAIGAARRALASRSRSARRRRPCATDASDEQTLVVAASELAGYDRSSLSVLWGALAGRVGLALDRRGTTRCAAFTMKSPETGHDSPLGRLAVGGACATSSCCARLRRMAAGESVLPDVGRADVGHVSILGGRRHRADDEWGAELSGGAPVVVRRVASRAIGWRRRAGRVGAA